MENIAIRVAECRPYLKHRITHIDDGTEIKKLPKPEWAIYTEGRGKIIIKDKGLYYDEFFFISESYWRLAEFERQWSEGLARLETDDSSCLVQNLVRLRNGQIHREWWLLYKIDNKIHARCKILFEKEDADQPFTPENCYSFIPSYKTHEDDGEEIPELVVGFE